jgi:hypothetical protein
MRHIIRTGLNTVTTAYTPLLVNDYRPILLMGYGTGRAYLFATGFGAVHTGEPGK